MMHQQSGFGLPRTASIGGAPAQAQPQAIVGWVQSSKSGPQDCWQHGIAQQCKESEPSEPSCETLMRRDVCHGAAASLPQAAGKSVINSGLPVGPGAEGR